MASASASPEDIASSGLSGFLLVFSLSLYNKDIKICEATLLVSRFQVVPNLSPRIQDPATLRPHM